MGEARRTMVIENTEKVITRKRPQKPLKAVSHGAENLIAIRSLQSIDSVRPLAEKPVVTRVDPTIVPAHPFAVKADDFAADFSDVHASNDNDAAVTSVAAATQFARRNKVAMGVLAAITVGAVIGSTRMSTVLHKPIEKSSNLQLSSSLGSKQSLEGATRDTEKVLPANAPSVAAINNPITERWNETSQQAKQYLDEIEQLRALNVSLHEEVDKLGAETTDLNYELLQLELALAEKEASEQALVETRTVYNFVNVPTGSNVQDFGNTEDSNYTYSNEQQSLNEQYYDESEQYYEEPIPIEWDSNGQPVAFADAYTSEEPIEWDSNGQPVEYAEAYSDEATLEGGVYSEYENEQYYDPNDNVNYQFEQ